MTTKPREQMFGLGPCAIPLVPIADMSKFALTREQWHAAWRIVGPTAERNMNRNPLWVVIASAYLEGLMHGYELKAEMARRGEKPDEPLQRSD